MKVMKATNWATLPLRHVKWIDVDIGDGVPQKVKISFGPSGVLVHPYKSRFTWHLPIDAVARMLAIEAQKRYANRMLWGEEAERANDPGEPAASSDPALPVPVRMHPEAESGEGVSGDGPLLPVPDAEP